MDLTDEQWAMLEALLPEPTKRADKQGRPWREAREVLDSVLWVLRTGAPWRDLPRSGTPGAPGIGPGLCGLPRTPLPRTPVNKGKKKGQGCYASALVRAT